MDAYIEMPQLAVMAGERLTFAKAFGEVVFGNVAGEPDASNLNCASVSDLASLLDSLMDQIPNIRNYLNYKNFSDYVIERSIDRVIHAAIPYLRGNRSPSQIRDWNKWLFGSAFKAAVQEASREPKCQFVDPAILDARTLDEPDEELQQQIGAAMAMLTDKQRQAVELCIMQEQSLAEAAREMNCRRHSTVQYHRDRGLLLLRGILSSSAFFHSAKLASYLQRSSPASL
jgi:hypothetical protein